MDQRTSVADLTAIIPLRADRTAMSRMAPALDQHDRLSLLARTFERVVVAALEARCVSDVLVVGADARARTWAARLGVGWLQEPQPGAGLRLAIAAADADVRRRRGEAATLVLPADLPLATAADLDAVAAALPARPGVVVCPTADGGTGALLRAAGDVIASQHGADSARAHLRAAAAAGVAAISLWRPGLAVDLDRPDDLRRMRTQRAAGLGGTLG